jgi:hypothetical protein
VRRRRLPDPEAERERAAIHAEMVGLGGHPSWPTLQREVVREKSRIERRIINLAMNPAGLDQREVDLLRGFIKGMEWIATLPDDSERSLERYLAQQGVPSREEQE